MWKGFVDNLKALCQSGVLGVANVPGLIQGEENEIWEEFVPMQFRWHYCTASLACCRHHWDWNCYWLAGHDYQTKVGGSARLRNSIYHLLVRLYKPHPCDGNLLNKCNLSHQLVSNCMFVQLLA